MDEPPVWLGEGKQDIASGQLRPNPLGAVLAEVLSASIIRTPHSICSGRVVMVSCLMGCFGMFLCKVVQCSVLHIG